MRKFDFKLPTPEIGDQFGPIDDVEGHPAYQAGVFDAVQIDELEDGSLIFNDMTAILLNQEKYRRLLGDMNVNNILAQLGEHLLCKQRVVGSIPSSSTNLTRALKREDGSCLLRVQRIDL